VLRTILKFLAGEGSCTQVRMWASKNDMHTGVCMEVLRLIRKHLLCMHRGLCGGTSFDLMCLSDVSPWNGRGRIAVPDLVC
jgi:hypothetical protein